MKVQVYNCKVTLGNMSVAETDMQKKAMSDFLKAFLIKPRIEKILYGESRQTDYYYLAHVSFSHYNMLRVLRFVESLRAFCTFWNMSLVELGFYETDSSSLE